MNKKKQKRLKVNADIFYKTLLTVLFFVPILFESIELNTIASLLICAVVILDREIKLSKTLVNTLSPLIAIISIGALSSVFYPSTIYDFFKDFFLFLKPILYILIGYYSVSKIKDKFFLFKIIVVIAILFAIYHVLIVLFFVIDNPIVISQIRSVGGKANYIELFALVILFVNKKHGFINKRYKHQGLIKLLLSVSFVLYFSRTMFVGIVILIIAINGYLKVSKKGLNYMFGIVLSISFVYILLFVFNPERGAEGFEGFAYKIKIAPSEIFASEIDENDHTDLWDNWRGYEVVKAIDELERTKYNIGFISGKGLGALIDLGFLAPLNKEGIQYIPKIHNGYVNVIFKTGFIGVFIYLIFLIYLYLQTYVKTKSNRNILFNNTISGISVYFIFTSFIISGIYNQSDIFTLVLGGLIYLKHYYFNQKNENENRNIRNQRRT